MNKKYTWQPDLPDRRDLTLDHLTLEVTKVTSPVMDVKKWCSKVQNQGQLGSCTGNALAGYMNYNEIRKLGSVTTTYRDFSRLFIYFNERTIEHTVSQDSGAQIRDGVKSLAKWGCCPEKEWPYVVSKFTNKPTTQCFKDALANKITSYHRLSTTDDMRLAIANYLPFVFGFTVYDSFESDQVAQTGIVPMPSSDEKVLGGHAVLGVGYNDKTQRFLVRNSWGKSWGQGGYFTIPYAYLADRNLSDDFWVIVK